MAARNKIVIEVQRGCVNVASEIPTGIELVIRDYDIEPDSDSKKDRKGPYEETSWTSEDNEGLLSKFKRGF